MKLKKGDIIIILILVAAVAGYFYYNNLDSDGGKKVIIEINGEQYKAISMRELKEKQELHIELPNDKFIEIVLEEDGVYVSEVDCPDQICKKTGTIYKVGQSIVCLPNRVIIYIEGEVEPEVDGVT